MDSGFGETPEKMNDQVKNFDICWLRLLAMLSVLVTNQALAQKEPIQMEGTNIYGSTELPKVLYIVPWKKTELGDVIMQPGTSIFGEELAPLDRDIFQRQIQYYDLLQQKELKAAKK